MSKDFLSKAMTFLSVVLLASVLHAQTNDATAITTDQQPTASKDATTSKVRIVRLSMVKGAVQIERSREHGFERAIANLPVVERNLLQTGMGVAEVEFEDNSSLRLAPNTLVEFPALGRNASGATESAVHVTQGTVYVSLMKPQNSKTPVNDFTLTFGDRKLTLDPATHVRLDIDGTQANLAVLDGSVRVDSNDGTLTIDKKRTATFSVSGDTAPTVAKDIEKTEFDGWDHDATSYHARVATLMGSGSGYAGTPYSYGVSDMAYYGSFMDAGSCGMGMMWRPYFASAAWDPFGNGTWAWYPGAGYSWVSPYPWAWTPYHSGSWGYCPSMGWGWMPGGSWYGVNNVASLTPAAGRIPTGGGGGPRLLPPPHAPLPHQPTFVTVTNRPLTTSMVTSQTSFEFRKDSAGIGVPRGTMGNLAKFSHQTESRGVATTNIYVNVPQAGGHFGGSSSMVAAGLGSSIHRGSAPSYSGSSSGSSWASSGGGGSGSSMSSSSRSTTSMAPSAPSAPSGGGTRK